VSRFVGHTVRYVDVVAHDAAAKDAALCVLVGEKLGSGVFRDVYAVKGREDVVLKIEDRGGEFCNVMEWKLWTEAQGTPAEQWLAPCLDLSGLSGRALVMRRTQPMTEDAWETLEVPAFFNDIQPSNWGLLNGRPVCHDYAHSNVLLRGLRVGKPKRVAREA
jgi:hypothetical protein